MISVEVMNVDSLAFMVQTDRRWDCVFADPPDNIGLEYQGVNDKMSSGEYRSFMISLIAGAMRVAPVLWLSFNARHTVMLGSLLDGTACEVKPCIQTFTFGSQRKKDLSNCHRPLWRIARPGELSLYPDSVRVKSWRQLNGDKRASQGGKVPSDVFDFPRVTGNSKQRRSWHPTQLHEGLVERCIKLVTKEGDSVLDPFAGTGTTGRVCQRINRDVTLLDVSAAYCEKLKEELLQ